MPTLNSFLPLLADLAPAVLALALATLATLVVAARPTPLDTVRLLRECEAEVDYGRTVRRPTLLSRLRRHLRTRLDRAGHDGWSLWRFALVSLGYALAGLVAARLTLGAVVFVVGGALCAAAVPWVRLGMQGEKRRRAEDEEIARALSLMASAAAAGKTLHEIIYEVLPPQLHPPLAEKAARARRRFDRSYSVTGANLLDVIADLDARLHSGPFSLARAAIEEDRAEGVGLADALAIIATLARDDLSFQSEVRANFAKLRGTALLIFVFPFLMTFLYRLVNPSMVDQAYGTPLGWLVAVAVALSCAAAYYLVTLGERNVARQAVLPEAGS
jgi:Flp pilus assembly protein TadB